MKKAFLSSVAVALLCASANGQAFLSFSGGNGSPLTLTLAQPITYTITLAGPNGNAPFFFFDAVGNFANVALLPVSGSIVFTINGGAPQSFTRLSSGFGGNNVTPDDAYIFGALPGVAVGDTVTLGAGTLTTTNNFVGAPPSSGSFATFIADGNGSQLSSAGIAVPEPGSLTLAVVAGLGLLVFTRRRRH